MRINQTLREALVKAGYRMSPEARRTEIELTKKFIAEKEARKQNKENK